MNNEIKVNLSFTIPGRVLLSEQECSKNPENSYEKGKLDLRDRKGRPYSISFDYRKCKPVTQTININKEAFEYMVSESPVNAVNKKAFKRMTINQRLELHLQQIVESLGGSKYSYTIFED